MISSRDRKPVIVGLDGSKTDVVSFSAAAAEATRRGTSLLAVHAWLITDDHLPLEGGVRIDPAIEDRLGTELQRTVRDMAADTDLEDIESRVVYGYAGDVLCRLSQQADLALSPPKARRRPESAAPTDHPAGPPRCARSGHLRLTGRDPERHADAELVAAESGWRLAGPLDGAGTFGGRHRQLVHGQLLRAVVGHVAPAGGLSGFRDVRLFCRPPGAA